MTPDKHPTTIDRTQRLFERGLLHLDQTNGLAIEITRGMTILTNEGQEAGKVAAVVVDKVSQQVSHLLLRHLRLSPKYRLVPVNLIEQINQEAIVLRVGQQIVDSLPVRQAS
jgi:sporulation protein YlmC with PRC-barrel domain